MSKRNSSSRRRAAVLSHASSHAVEALEARRMLSVAEPNNSLATAAPVDAVGGFAGLAQFSDFVGDSDTVDYYRLNIPKTNQNDFSARLYNLSANLNMQLINDANNNGVEDAGEVISSSSNAGTSEESFKQILGIFRGPFYLKVFSAGPGNNSNYSLDLFNDSTNDTSNPLTRHIPTNGVHTLTEGLNNIDDFVDLYFMGDLQPSGRNGPSLFSARLTTGNPDNYHVDLIQDTGLNGLSDGGTLLTTSHTIGGAALIPPMVLPGNSGGYFYLRVLHSTLATDSYTLQTFSDYAGNTIAAARTMNSIGANLQTFHDEVGTTMLPTTLDTADFYRLDVRDPGVTIDASISRDEGQDPTIFNVTEQLIRDANNNGVVDPGEVLNSAATNAGTGGGTVSFLRSVAPGTYYLLVTGGPFTNYTLDIGGDSVAPFVQRTPLHYSDSKDLGSLGGANFESDALSAPDPGDLFKFTLPRAGSIFFDVFGFPYTATLLADSNHDDVINFTTEKVTDLTSSFGKKVPLAAGTYYIYMEQAGESTDYSFSLIADYAGETAQTARNMGTLGAFSGVADYVEGTSFNTDVDFYKFSLASAQTFTAALNGSLSGDNERSVNLELFKEAAAGELISLQQVSSNGQFALLQRSLAAGNYQLKVSATKGSDDYRLGFSTGDNDDSIPEADLTQNNQLPIGQSRDYTLSSASDVDMVEFDVFVDTDEPAQTLAFDLDSRNGSNVNTFLRLFDAAGHQLGSNDNGTAPGERASGFSFLTHTFAPGTEAKFYLGISSAGNNSYNPLTGGGDAGGSSTGQYRVTISQVAAPPPTGSISGTLFRDTNGNGVKDGGEVAMAGQTIWIDLDNDKIVDSNETKTTTDSSGNYKLSGLAAGTYKVRELPPAGWQQTTPLNGLGISVTLGAGQNVSGKTFGLRPITGTGSIAGTIFHDFDRDGVRDAGDTGIAAWRVYIDTNNNGVLDSGEISVLTDSNGNYKFSNLSAATYKVREQRQSGFVQTTPANNFGISVALAAGQSATGKNFGVDN